MHLLQKLAACLALLGAPLLVHFHKDRVDRDGWTKLDHCARAEFVRMKVGQADGDELDVEPGVGGDRAEGHDRESGLEGEKVGTVMRSSLKCQLAAIYTRVCP